MNRIPIADMHCDLLAYLAGDRLRTPFDRAARCSIPQLIGGNVKFQTMAIYTPTEPGSVISGLSQVACFKELCELYTRFFTPYSPTKSLKDTSKISVIAAVENASSFFEEESDLDSGFALLDRFEKEIGKIFYLSLTWNTNNRFGGGAHGNEGITPDGSELLRFMADKKIAIDLSHASDRLAYDIIEELNKNSLEIPILASHSNTRTVANVPRNLPDELIKEIISRKGIVGFNFVRQFVGPDVSAFNRQLEHFLDLGAENSLVLGADFFYGYDVPLQYRKLPEELYFPGYEDSFCYSKVLDLWREILGENEEILTKICWKNLDDFLQKNIPVSEASLRYCEETYVGCNRDFFNCSSGS